MAGAKPNKLKRTPKEKTYATMEEAGIHCGVSDTTIRDYVKRYPDLPVHRKGTGGKKNGYQFDLDDLDRWREKNNLLNWSPRMLAGEGAQSQNNDPNMPQRPTSTKDRRALIQTELLQIELDKEKGLLVDRAEVIKACSTIFARLARQLDLIPGSIGRELSLVPELVELLRDKLDKARIAICKNDKGFWDITAAEEAADADQLI